MAIQLVGVALKRAAFAIEVDGFPLKRVDDDRPAWSSELPVPVVALGLLSVGAIVPVDTNRKYCN